MASANQKLTKDWIQYLKNNQIVELQSNPKTGRLKYKRQPTVTDLTTYLGKDYDEDAILDAIQQVKGKDAGEEDPTSPEGELTTQGNRDPSTWHQSEVTPGEPLDGIGNNPTRQTTGKKFNTDDAEDAKYSQRGVVPRTGSRDPSTWHNSEMSPAEYQDQIGAEMPWQEKPKKYNTDNAQDAKVKDKSPRKLGSIPKGIEGTGSTVPSGPEDSTPTRKPRFKYRYKKGQLKEAIRDWQGDTLSEKEIQEIFKILVQPVSKKGTVSADNAEAEAPSQEETEEQVRKLKRVIRDTMTDQQRAALYRALTDV